MKPGEFKRARARHLALQRRRDAIVALRAGETIWITVIDGDTGKLTRCKVEPGLGVLACGKLLCFAGRTLRACQIIDKDGLKAWIRGRSTRRITLDCIFGRVVEQHDRLFSTPRPGGAA